MERFFKKFSTLSRGIGLSFFVATAVWVSGCSSNSNFTQQATTQYFLQSYNPQYLDILWMVDLGSEMSVNETSHANLVNQASILFGRLDALAQTEYRMALVSQDATTNPGGLLPYGSPTILQKNYGTVAERTAFFQSLFASTFNLNTSGMNEGFLSMQEALGNTFTTQSDIPLALVTLSDRDDRSPANGLSGQAAVSYYASSYQALKNSPNLVQAYSINYTENGARCFTSQDADIDITTGPFAFQNRYFLLASTLGGATADICTSWADSIDLSGLQLQQLPSSFQLQSVPASDSIQVSIFDASGNTYTDPSTYNSATNSIVFSNPPPAGTTIQVTYIPQ